jgi:arylsulfatase A-like enzyme
MVRKRTGVSAKAKETMNIILIVFDTLRKDCVGAYGSPPWAAIQTPHFDAFARESLMMTRAYPESLPTLPARRALYTGKRVYPFHGGDFRLKGDFIGAPGWGPIPEDQQTLAELLSSEGYRTGLVCDVPHMFKPSKNFWRGFDQWVFLRGQTMDPQRSGPRPSQAEMDEVVPKELQTERILWFMEQCITNLRDRTTEEDYFPARVFAEASAWLEQNQDADRLFLTVECFDPHEPWFVPEHYRRLYIPGGEPYVPKAPYGEVDHVDPRLLSGFRGSYAGLVTMCDRWFGHFVESVRVLGLLDETLIILVSDHGHTIGEGNYFGKRGYPSRPEVCEVPLMIRHPQGKGAGLKSDLLVQHTDVAATILDAAGMALNETLDGQPFLESAVRGGPPLRDHVTVGWGPDVTVIDGRWWLNCKVDGTKALLYDLASQQPFEQDLAREQPELVRRLFEVATRDAAGGFPDWLLELAGAEEDSPGCTALTGRT